ncbi:MAG TPA: glycosyltransferase family 1 protein [Acidimicrobiales bacterium]
MRVAVNAEQLFYGSPGGVGRYTAQLLTVLPQLFPGDEVVPFTARHRHTQVAATLDAAGVDPATRARAVVLNWPRPLLYRGWVSVGRPHLPGLPGAELVHAPSVAVPPHPRVPLVVTVHDTAAELFPETFPSRGRRFHHQGLAAAARRADLVLTVSTSAASEITAHSTIRPDRIRVIPNGVAPLRVAPARRLELLAARGLDGPPFVLWVGSLEPRKGVGTLVAAMARLRRRGGGPAAGVHLVLAGYPGWLDGDLAPAADLATLGGGLRQLGRVSEEELWALYGGASLFAFPSRHEGFGLPVLEAMSQGTPVVAADIPALREVAGGAARLVAPGDIDAWADALGDLLHDAGERRRMGQAGVAQAARFDVASTISGIRAAYCEVLGR